MLHIAICDDNPFLLELTEECLKECCANILPESLEYEILESFGSAEEVLEYLSHDPIDVLFSDIDMPGLNGYELAEKIRETNKEMVIVFVSGYDRPTRDTSGINLFGYIKRDRLDRDLPGVIKRLGNRPGIETRS